jgi:hypothetical protein
MLTKQLSTAEHVQPCFIDVCESCAGAAMRYNITDFPGALMTRARSPDTYLQGTYLEGTVHSFVAVPAPVKGEGAAHRPLKDVGGINTSDTTCRKPHHETKYRTHQRLFDRFWPHDRARFQGQITAPGVSNWIRGGVMENAGIVLIGLFWFFTSSPNIIAFVRAFGDDLVHQPRLRLDGAGMDRHDPTTSNNPKPAMTMPKEANS